MFEPGNLITIIGGANQGKSYFAKQLINNRFNCLVFDFQNSYGEKSTKPGDIILNLPMYQPGQGAKNSRCRYIGTPEEFISICQTRINSFLIFEEATIFLEGRTSEEMRKLLVNRYHVGNIIIIIFHSINAVPPRILEMSDYIVLFKTNDGQTNIKRKSERLLNAHLKLRDKPNRSKIILKMI